jgi:L-threonylcarbamoyladenylate synthase
VKILNKEKDFKTIVNLIKSGEIVCSPTDTQMGLLGSALNQNSVERVYRIKDRKRSKPLIILFSDLEQMELFGIEIPQKFIDFLKSTWPERLTVILQLKEISPFKKLFNRNNLAVRIPKNEFLIKLISETGPLFAPSANPEGKQPARNCEECEAYFKNRVNYCIKNGQGTSLPSTIVDLTKEKGKVIREGAFKFNHLI